MLLEFLKGYWPVILFVLGFVIYIGYLLFNRRWDEIRELVYNSTRQAEQTIMGTKMGQKRFDTVLTELYKLLPVWIRIFVPKFLIKRKLQKLYDGIKDYLDDGKINNSTQEELPKPPDIIPKKNM